MCDETRLSYVVATRVFIILDERQKKVEITPGFGDGPTFNFMVDQSRQKDEDQLDVLYCSRAFVCATSDSGSGQ